MNLSRATCGKYLPGPGILNKYLITQFFFQRIPRRRHKLKLILAFCFFHFLSFSSQKRFLLLFVLSQIFTLSPFLSPFSSRRPFEVTISDQVTTTRKAGLVIRSPLLLLLPPSRNNNRVKKKIKSRKDFFCSETKLKLLDQDFLATERNRKLIQSWNGLKPELKGPDLKLGSQLIRQVPGICQADC